MSKLKIILIFLAGVMVLESTGYGVDVDRKNLRVPAFISSCMEQYHFQTRIGTKVCRRIKWLPFFDSAH